MRSKHQIPTIPISVSLQHIIIHQETEQAHEDITVVVGVCGDVASKDNYLSERVVDFLQ